MAEHVGKGSRIDALGGHDSPRAADPAPGKRTLVEQVTPVQRQELSPGPAGAGRPTEAVHAAAARGVASPTSALPHQETIQRAFGRHDVSSIQAHVGSGAAAAATRDMGAEAYATGNHVVLGGSPDLFTTAHEAAHVVQQRAGVHLKGGVGDAGDHYERHADEVASLVVQGKSAEPLLDEHAGAEAGSGTGAGSVQRKMEFTSGTEYLDIHGGGQGISAPGYHDTLNEAIAMGPSIVVRAAQPAQGTAAYSPDPVEMKGEIKIQPLSQTALTQQTSDYQERIIAMAHETRHGIDDLTKKVKFRFSGKDAEKIQTEWRAFASQSTVAWQLAEQQQPVPDRYLMDLTSYDSVNAFMKPGARMFEVTKSYMRLYGLKPSPTDIDVSTFMSSNQTWIVDAVALFVAPIQVVEAVALNVRPGAVNQTAWRAKLAAAGWSGAGAVARATIIRALCDHFGIPS